ncbi:hypothetical protein LTR85_003267 [Meristemomyces frigidus]|nr:hypothetical protein LTR85_003267 [Meristemomyces frigidus]
MGVKKRHIIVLDAGDDVFRATSRTNTACLLYSEMSEDIRAFGEYSFNLWRSLGKQKSFRESTGFQDKALFEVKTASGGGYGKGHELAPDWVSVEDGWSVEHALGSAPSLQKALQNGWCPSEEV